MKLPKPFYRLPLRLDVARMQEEVRALDPDIWVKHPNEIKGNSSVRLISAGGGENDDVEGRMLPTPHLERLPYLRQILASFGVVWSRSRLMRLDPKCGVPQHADINHHWFYRVRVHMPIFTYPEVRFRCGDEVVHMGAGEVWLFDNWRLHEVENPTDRERIHFVADTSGSAAFWQFVGASGSGSGPIQDLRFDPDRSVMPLTEQVTQAVVMNPSELELLALDLASELESAPVGVLAQQPVTRYRALIESFCRDWRQLYALHGAEGDGAEEFSKLLESVRAASLQLGESVFARTNRIGIHKILEGRVLRHALRIAPNDQRKASPTRSHSSNSELHRPIFIVAAPRSGSTLLFESLAAHRQIATLGDEAHWLVENDPALRPGPGGVDSNRLGVEQATQAVRTRMLEQIAARLQDSNGQRVSPSSTHRFLEKTPKNALRIPFFDKLFPNAQFIFLWRDPRESISSIVEAWKSGQWKTYNGLDGFDGPWSLLLPPGWRAMNGNSVERIAAFQWDAANRVVLDDLAALTHDRYTTLSYADLLSNPREQLERICTFAGLEMDEGLSKRLANPLPLSKYTHTPPHADKWRRNEAQVESVLPMIDLTWQRLKALR